MHYTNGPGFDFLWRPNIFNFVLFKKDCERDRIHQKQKIFFCHNTRAILYAE